MATFCSGSSALPQLLGGHGFTFPQSEEYDPFDFCVGKIEKNQFLFEFAIKPLATFRSLGQFIEHGLSVDIHVFADRDDQGVDFLLFYINGGEI